MVNECMVYVKKMKTVSSTVAKGFVDLFVRDVWKQ